ncbi:MAG: 2-oxo acid dehydrogenase subunit E2 [Caldilineaceae bacterium]|nr:2-oxo acid dehydrogenase subunit E2 [Caldilineaceae bacterium]
MAVAVVMPQMGESVVEGTVSRWLKAPGDAVTKLEPLLEIATDKIDTEVPAPADGTLLRVVVPDGETVAAGTVLAYIGAPEEAVPDEDMHETPAPDTVPHPSPIAATDDNATAARGRSGRSFISPVVARMAAEHDLDLTQIDGTGLGGRITKKDVQAYIARRSAAATPPAAPSTGMGDDHVAADEILHPLTTMRRAIARHMVQSKQSSPHVTTIAEVDMTRVVRHREAVRHEVAAKGLTLTYTAYFVAAVAAGLQAVPAMNSRFTEAGVVESKRIHVGLAVAVANGLLVPVIRDADERNLVGLAREIAALTTAARDGTLDPDALHGGTFTITNHGTGGSLLATPIINQPQAGILGIGAIVKRPVVRSAAPSLLPSADDAIVIRPMCYLSLSFDHRVLDGARADEFLTVVKQTLEDWQ